MNDINILFLLGLMGERYSIGVRVIRERIRSLLWKKGVDYMVESSYSARRHYIPLINGWNDPTVIIGHSFGANAACEIAREVMPGKIPLLISLDASQYWNFRTWWTEREVVPDHVDKVVHFYQRQSLIRGVLHERPDGSTRGIDNILVDARHPLVDDKPRVHDHSVAEIQHLVKSLNPPQPIAA